MDTNEQTQPLEEQTPIAPQEVVVSEAPEVAPVVFDPPLPAPLEPHVESVTLEEGGQVEPDAVEVPIIEEKKIEDVAPEVLAEAALDNPPQEIAEEEALNLPESFEPHGQWDPSFNCQPCLGEGLIVDVANPQGKICETCKGTGKI